MPWLAAAAMCALYLYNLPLVFAIVVNARGLGFGVGAFEARFAKESAKKRILDKAWYKKHSKRFTKINKKLPSRAALELGWKVLKAGKLERLDVKMTIGTGDAALTAQACGLAMIAAHTLRAATGAEGTTQVTPDFAKATLSGEACGILRLRAGHIMKAAAQTILRGAGG